MDSDLLETEPGATGSFIREFLIPGEVAWDLLHALSPPLAAQLSGDGDPSRWLLAALATIVWLAALLLLVQMAKMVCMTTRRLINLVARLRHQALERFYDGRAALRLRLKCLTSGNGTTGTEHEEIELDELDLAVLDHGATLAPGFSISVIDVAELVRARPSQVQRSLNKLRSHQLVDPTLGSSDGYGNYCLTDSGAWFINAHKRHNSMGTASSPQSVAPGRHPRG